MARIPSIIIITITDDKKSSILSKTTAVKIANAKAQLTAVPTKLKTKTKKIAITTAVKIANEKAKQHHGIVRAKLESTVKKLEEEASTLKKKQQQKQQQQEEEES